MAKIGTTEISPGTLDYLEWVLQRHNRQQEALDVQCEDGNMRLLAYNLASQGIHQHLVNQFAMTMLPHKCEVEESMPTLPVGGSNLYAC